jgi:hypothetical protein
MPVKGEDKPENPTVKTSVVKGRVFDQFAEPITEVFQVTNGEWDYEGMPSAATFENGEIYVSWKTCENVGVTAETAIWGVRLGVSGQDLGAQQLKAGFDPKGHYPFYAPVAIAGNERAFIVWHTVDNVEDGVYLRRYYPAEDVMDCEVTNVAGAYMEGEAGARRLPAVYAFEDGRTLVAWETYLSGVTTLVVRYVK